MRRWRSREVIPRRSLPPDPNQIQACSTIALSHPGRKSSLAPILVREESVVHSSRRLQSLPAPIIQFNTRTMSILRASAPLRTTYQEGRRPRPSCGAKRPGLSPRVLFMHPATHRSLLELMKDMHRDETHAPFLVGLKDGVERLPRFGELVKRFGSLQVGRVR